MVTTIVGFIFSNFFLCMTVFAILVALMHIMQGDVKTNLKITDALLGYTLFFAVGWVGIYGFIAHAFFPEFTAKFIGWYTSPFQFEVAVANLSLGITGIVAFWSNFSFRMAVIISVSCFYFGSAIGHINQMLTANNFAPGNAGSVFLIDIFLPIFLIILALVRRKVVPHQLHSRES